MRTVRIYQPLPNPMQGGVKKNIPWVMRFEPQSSLYPTMPMKWLGSRDMDQELRLEFSSLIQAIDYAKGHDFSYRVVNPSKEEISLKSYGNNFLCPRLRGKFFS